MAASYAQKSLNHQVIFFVCVKKLRGFKIQL